MFRDNVIMSSFSPCRDLTCYEPLNHIKEGTYGVVTRARDKHTGRIVALKKVKVNSLEEIFPVTSLREIHILRQFSHVNIVKLYEVITSTKREDVYLVLELVEHDLRDIMQIHGMFTISEVKTIMQQVLTGVEQLHNRYIMHRDLKTANLLLTNNGIVKITDFGLATQYGSDRRLTTTVVTLWYRAPELLLAKGARIDYGPEIDMWSIGCILAELLKNDAVLKGMSEIEQIKIILDQIGVSESEWNALKRFPGTTTVKKPKRWCDEREERPLGSVVKRKQVTENCIQLMFKFLALDPASRVTAGTALKHQWFSEPPLPKNPDLFPSFPSSAKLEYKPKDISNG